MNNIRKNTIASIFGIILILLLDFSCRKHVDELDNILKNENFSIEFYDKEYYSNRHVFFYLTDFNGIVVDSVIRNGQNKITFSNKLDANINAVNIAHYKSESKKFCTIKTFLDVKSSKWYLRNPESKEFLNDIHFNFINKPTEFEFYDIALSYKIFESGQYSLAYDGAHGSIKPAVEPNNILLSIKDVNKSGFINNLYSDNTYTIDYQDFKINDTAYINFPNIIENFKTLMLYGYENSEYPYTTMIESARFGDPDLINKRYPIFYPHNIFNNYQTNIFFGNNFEWKYIFYGSIPSVIEPYFMDILVDSVNSRKYNINVAGTPTYCLASFYYSNDELQLRWEIYFSLENNNLIIPNLPIDLVNLIGFDPISLLKLNYIEVHKIIDTDSYNNYIKKKFEENKLENVYINQEIIYTKHFL